MSKPPPPAAARRRDPHPPSGGPLAPAVRARNGTPQADVVTPLEPKPPAATIVVQGLKINTLIDPHAFPASLVPPEPAPAGFPVLELRWGGVPVRATLNGKSVRKVLKLIALHGPDGVNVVLQGVLKPPARAGETAYIECPGLSATVKPTPEAKYMCNHEQTTK